MRLAPTLLSFAEYKALGDKAVADGLWRNDRRIFLPGMGWFNDWYLDRDLGRDFLSPHYYRDWAGKRPPIELVCPDGNIWCIDRRSSNGDGGGDGRVAEHHGVSIDRLRADGDTQERRLLPRLSARR